MASSLLRVAPALALLLVALLAVQARAEPLQTGSSLDGSAAVKRKVLAAVTPIGTVDAVESHGQLEGGHERRGRLASTRVLQQVIMPPVVVIEESSGGEASLEAGPDPESSPEESSTGLAPWQLGRRMLRGN